MAKLKNFLINYLFIILSFFYFLVRIINLTKLPIFNDEAIYLDWGWKEIHLPGNLFYSLYDAKQPLLMWIFGLFESILPDPLFAGRIVSVFTGYLAWLGIYFIGKRCFNKKVAFLALFTFILTPFFSFYDRQALMESAVLAIGLWSFYFFLLLYEEKNYKNAVLLGLLLGIGFFIKSSVLVFFAAIFILGLYISLKEKSTANLKLIVTSFLISQVVLVPLYLQKAFWTTFPKNSRFVLTLGELIHFPFSVWGQNSLHLIEILFWHLTPFVFLIGTAGMISLLKSSHQEKKFLSLWLLTTILITVLTIRKISPRYIVSFLPTMTLFFAHALIPLFKKQKNLSFSILVLSSAFLIWITGLQVLSPIDYFSTLNKLTRFSQKGEYITGWTSGYGVNKVRQFLENKRESEQILVGVRLDAGNPESAIFTYFSKKENIKAFYFDARLITPNVSAYDCIKSNLSIYFISRDEILAGLDNFMEEIKRIYKPEGKSFIGIYRLKSKCEGKTLFI